MGSRLPIKKLKNLNLIPFFNFVCNSCTGQVLRLGDYVFEENAKYIMEDIRRYLTPDLRRGKHKAYITNKRVSELTLEEEQALVDCTDEIIAVIHKYASKLDIFPDAKTVTYEKFIKDEKRNTTKRKVEMVSSGEFEEDPDNPGCLKKVY